VRLCLTRRVVKALVIDIFAVGRLGEKRLKLIEERSQLKYPFLSLWGQPWRVGELLAGFHCLTTVKLIGNRPIQKPAGAGGRKYAKEGGVRTKSKQWAAVSFEQDGCDVPSAKRYVCRVRSPWQGPREMLSVSVERDADLDFWSGQERREGILSRG